MGASVDQAALAAYFKAPPQTPPQLLMTITKRHNILISLTDQYQDEG